MKDRIPLNPGRVKLTPVTGETDLFDMEMADNPTELGTALNKANLLTDATAAAILAEFGSTPDTPNEALAAITAGSGKTELQSYAGTGTYDTSNKNTLAFAHEPKLVLILGHYNPYGGGSVAIQSAQSAILPWAAIVANYTAHPSSCTFGRLGDINASLKYTLANDNKTISWWSTSSADIQMNENNFTYYVVSFY